MDYTVKISELKLGSIKRYEALKLFSRYIFQGNDNFAVFADSANIIVHKVNFLLQTMKLSW